jgi:hypothetical protein
MKLAAVASLALAVVLSLAGRAAAQPGLTPPGSTPMAEPMPEPEIDPELAPLPAPAQPPRDEAGAPLSEGTALALSLGGTVVSWGLLGAAHYVYDKNGQATAMMGLVGGFGIVAAPSAGHWYAGTRGTRGLAVRLAGVATLLAGAVYKETECPLFSFGHDDGPPCIPQRGSNVLLVGLGLVLAGTIDDIVTAPSRVRRHNERLSNLAIAPMLTGSSAGLALGGRF